MQSDPPIPSAEALALVDAIGSPSWTDEHRNKLAREFDAFAAAERRGREQAEQQLQQVYFAVEELTIRQPNITYFVLDPDGRKRAVPYEQVYGIHEAIYERSKECAPSAAKAMEAYHEHRSLVERAERAEAERETWRGVATRARDDMHRYAAERDARPTVEHVKALRHALAELCRWHREDGDCWCEMKPNGHSPGCKAARSALAPAGGGEEPK